MPAHGSGRELSAWTTEQKYSKYLPCQRNFAQWNRMK